MNFAPISPHRARAFSLLELLIGVTILAVLAMIGSGVLGRMRVRAKDMGCAVHLRQVGVALLAYAGDHRQEFPFVQGQYPYNAPLTLARNLVGTYGAAGYLPWDGSRKMHMWSNAMLCPGDPNTDVYNNIYFYPGSYVYRQNEEAGDVSNTPISLVSRRSSQEGYKRWIVMDRALLGASGIVKPHKGATSTFSTPAGRWEPDRRGYASYWHEGGANVLYEDGSVRFRRVTELVSP